MAKDKDIDEEIFDELLDDSVLLKKLCKSGEKFFDRISKLTRDDIYRLRSINPRFNKLIEDLTDLIYGHPDKLWATHPQYSGIKCSKYGQIDITENAKYEIRYNDGVPYLHFRNSRRADVPGALIILQCFVECPGPLNQYTIHYMDNDPTNVKFSNLGWYRKFVT